MRPVIQLAKRLDEMPQVMQALGFRLRHFASDDDIRRWLNLRDAAFADVKPRPGSWTEADFQREFLSQPWWQPERMWLAEVPEAGEPVLVGSVTLGRRGADGSERAVIHWLMVHPSWHRRGVGTALLRAVERACWGRDWQTIAVETHSGWSAAVEFYLAHGYYA
jgi:GNAT superfamily N-acetyltransferase